MSSQLLKRPLPYLALILAHLIWGAVFVVAKITLEEFPPMSLAFLRFALASLLLAPFLLTQTKKIKIDKEDLPKLIANGVFIVTLNIAFFFEGIKKTTAIDASVLSLTIPLLSVILGWWVLKEKILKINIAGICLGLAGALIIVGLPQLLIGKESAQVLIGNILIIISSVAWVIGAVIVKPLLTKYSSLVVTSIAFLVGTITFILPAAFEYVQNPSWVDRVSILGILGLAFMVLLSSISAYFLFEWSLAKTSLASANLFNYIEPFVATFLGVTILGETITPLFWVGAILIGVGVFLGTFAKEVYHRHHKAHRI